MASASLSAVAGAILSPRLPHIALDRLITYLWDYLSTDHPSSSGEASKLQQLQNEWEALKDANWKLKTMQSEAKRLLKKDTQNVTVVRLLKKLNDVGYEIQDLESDLEYMELQRKVEDMNQAEADTCQPRGQKRWFSFPWANEKRRRLSSSESLKLPPDNMVDRISSLIKQINSIDSEMITQIKVDVLFNQILLNGIYDPWAKTNKRVTTSSTNERNIYGREDETKKLISLLLQEPNDSGSIFVVPILGMGGIGKTTLAQFAFDNAEIENYFDEKVWVFVSDSFDRLRITKEIVESLSTYATPMFPYGTTNLNLLETELKKRLTGKKKLLLVLDDVWSDEWQQLLAPLKLTKVESIKIIVTSRVQTVLAGLETGDRILLKRLYGDEYRSFFINCVFGNENPHNYSSALQNIGEQIMEKLKGSPLAIKTVGRLLGRNLTEEHWKHVLDSDLWEIGSDANDIMPALALTFHHLPEHLQLCFAFCSVFPKGHRINMNELIGMWIAHGYILESGTNSKTLEDIGEEYFEELKQLSLIEYKFQFKMHDLLHDLAQSVSQGEVCIYEGKSDKRISTNVRHLFVSGLVDLESVVRVSNSLRTLVLYGDDICSQVDLKALKRIRVLVVIDKNMQEFPEAVTHLKYLRYLDLSESSIKWVPKSLCRLYQLRVLRLPKLDATPSLFHSLINLRSFVSVSIVHSNNYQLMSVSPRANQYQMTREGGFRIAQLRNMNQLSGSLEIRGLENIENKEEARKANLKEKGLIKYLTLCWTHSVGDGCTLHDVQEEVFEGLQPHHNLKGLWIHGYMGSKAPSWLGTTPAALQMLTSIGLVGCRNWSRLLPSIGLLPFLEVLTLKEMENITIEGYDTATMIFPSLKFLQLIKLASVSFEEGMSSSSSSSSSSTMQSGGCKLFPLLETLIVNECDVVNGLPCWPVLAQLSKLHIRHSRGLDGQLPGCLKGHKSLTRLLIHGSKCETLLFDRGVMATLERLNDVTIEMCKELTSVDGLQVLPSLTSLRISYCHKLRWWWVEEKGTSEQQQQQQQQGVLLPKLSHLDIWHCGDLESLPACLPLLPSLETLWIKDCPKVRSLPEGGLPSSLRELLIKRCDRGLMERCQQELSPEWKISRSHFDELFCYRKPKEMNEESYSFEGCDYCKRHGEEWSRRWEYI
ncbi:hypothetical protein J5N97_018219 [Dioscorea zingiberensis]|uniref:Uncharacterized protein n=1 Tax=Dioscorea zingiberensis TaxID=325984 RepID=A0A9D5CNV3_9LILI|nr:hypothetical protein J5N97_018219 [Dioscorea zingiberensis]